MAEVNKGGRPREHDRDAIMEELVEWAKLPNSLNLNGFCCSREPPISPSKITNWAKECPRFRQAYEEAKAFIAQKREQNLALGTLHVKAYDLNASVYDHFLKDERRTQLEFEAEIKKQLIEWEAKLKSENGTVDPNTVEQFMSLMGQLSSLQSDRKIAAKSNKTDSKS